MGGGIFQKKCEKMGIFVSELQIINKLKSLFKSSKKWMMKIVQVGTVQTLKIILKYSVKFTEVKLQQKLQFHLISDEKKACYFWW